MNAIRRSGTLMMQEPCCGGVPRGGKRALPQTRTYGTRGRPFISTQGGWVSAVQPTGGGGVSRSGTDTLESAIDRPLGASVFVIA